MINKTKFMDSSKTKFWLYWSSQLRMSIFSVAYCPAHILPGLIIIIPLPAWTVPFQPSFGGLFSPICAKLEAYQLKWSLESCSLVSLSKNFPQQLVIKKLKSHIGHWLLLFPHPLMSHAPLKRSRARIHCCSLSLTESFL